MGLLVLAVPLAGHRCGGFCSTIAVLLHPKQSTAPQHNCMDQQVQLGQVAGQRLGVAAQQAGAVEAASAVAWAEVWVVAWETESAVV